MHGERDAKVRRVPEHTVGATRTEWPEQHYRADEAVRGRQAA
jgi:hypothetical protein